MALEIQGRRCRDKISLGYSANSGLIAGFGEISVRTRMRGGERGRLRTCLCVQNSRLSGIFGGIPSKHGNSLGTHPGPAAKAPVARGPDLCAPLACSFINVNIDI